MSRWSLQWLVTMGPASLLAYLAQKFLTDIISSPCNLFLLVSKSNLVSFRPIPMDFFGGVPLSNFWKIACWRNTAHWPMPSTLHVSRVVHRQRIRSVLVVAGVPHLCWSGPSSPPRRFAKALRRRLFKQETTSCFIVTSIKHEMAV